MTTNLDFKVSPNIIAFHLLDYGSKWEYHIHENIGKWLRHNISDLNKLETLFAKYAELRKPLGWEEETKLLTWAYEGFPEEQYSQLKPLVNEWLEMSFIGSDTNILGTATKKANKITPYVEQLKARFNSWGDEQMEKLKRLFPAAPKIASLPAFVVWGPKEGSLQGGANGMGVYSEINVPASDRMLERTFGTIIHEAYHKVLDPSSTLDSWVGTRDFRDKKYPHIQEGNNELNAHIEELIVYTCVDIYLFHDNPEERLEKYKDIHKYAELWTHILKFSPIILDYLNSKADIETTKEKIIEFAQQLAKNELK